MVKDSFWKSICNIVFKLGIRAVYWTALEVMGEADSYEELLNISDVVKDRFILNSGCIDIRGNGSQLFAVLEICEYRTDFMQLRLWSWVDNVLDAISQYHFNFECIDETGAKVYSISLME